MSGDKDREQPGAGGEDAAVARAWRQASDEQPPAALDAGILAAAREKVLPARPRSRSRWMQWQSLAAAATVAGLGFVLVQTVPRDPAVAPLGRIEAPASKPEVADMMRTEKADERKGVMAEAPAEAYLVEPGAPAAARAVGARSAPSASNWAERIDALHASGNLAEAAEALRNFRAADPAADSQLPESLREWARTVE